MGVQSGWDGVAAGDTLCSLLRDLVEKALCDFDNTCPDVIHKYYLSELLAWGQAFKESC